MLNQERLALFLQKEKAVLDSLIKDCQGLAGLIVNGHEQLKKPDCHIKNIFSTSSQKAAHIDCQSKFSELPFPNNYFDLVILYHVFDEAEDIKAILTEAKRILRQDGILLINGFERLRICARVMQRRFSKKTCMKRKKYDLLDIQAKLAELGFKLETEHFDFCKNKTCEKVLSHVVPFLGIGFWIKAQKEVRPLNPLAQWELKPLLNPVNAIPEYYSPPQQNNISNQP